MAVEGIEDRVGMVTGSSRPSLLRSAQACERARIDRTMTLRLLTAPQDADVVAAKLAAHYPRGRTFYFEGYSGQVAFLDHLAELGFAAKFTAPHSLERARGLTVSFDVPAGRLAEVYVWDRNDWPVVLIDS